MAAWTFGSLKREFAETRQDGALRTPVDAGPPKVRKRFTATSRFISGTLVLTSATARGNFDTFYETTTGEGGEVFDYTDPKDNSTVSARFAAPPTYRHLTGNGGSGTTAYEVDVTLEILP